MKYLIIEKLPAYVLPEPNLDFIETDKGVAAPIQFV